MPRSTASSGTPAFFHVSMQRPIERREQEQAGAAGALEMLFDFGEVVEVVECPVAPSLEFGSLAVALPDHGEAFERQMLVDVLR